ncbi:MAG TPA: prolyl oligopeptidase family serine peptidase [Pseudonocardia sp.]|uniref:S9 family peptidase n=1 Tax=Pseudonocardia sp. TaxID=60912 RepID=UPI002F4000EF
MTDTSDVTFSEICAANAFSERRRARLAGAGGHPGSDPMPLLAARSVTSAALSPDGRALAFVSDHDGLPALWLATDPTDPAARVTRLDTGPDQVHSVSWSPDGQWLACLLAPFGGERTRVLTLRPDGSHPSTLAGGAGSAGTLGAWRSDGAAVGVTESARRGGGESTAYAVDPATGRRTPLATGPAAAVCSLHPNGRHAVVRVGRRGARQLLWVDIRTGRTVELLADSDATVADARFAVGGGRLYLHTDSGRERAALLTLALRDGRPHRAEQPAVVAARPDADLDLFAVHRSRTGERLVTVWNVDGYSELSVLEPDGRSRVHECPAEVVTSCVFSPDGRWLLIGAEGPAQPPHLVRHELRDGATQRLLPAAAPSWPPRQVVEPQLLRFAGQDGLALSGWWYAPSTPLSTKPAPTPTVLWLHGGPEAQERPTFAPLLQAMVAAGVAVFAPNVRGSSGYGRDFVNADNGEQRFAAIADVAAAARFLAAEGLADPRRLGVCGRSYGGYLTLAALVAYPELFAVGVDVCGMADLETFFAHTEPWIAAAATSKYGDPSRDRALLRELSPLHRIERLTAPLLVVHGEHDTNVPLVEAEQVVHALRERGAAPGFLLFPDEGHEVHGTKNRAVFVREVVGWLTGHLLEADEQTA